MLTDEKNNTKKRYIGKIIAAFLFGAVIMLVVRYITYGGMNTGTQVNNEEFQELKLNLFRKVVEEYNCKAFVLEADYGGCLMVKQYIHGEGKVTEDEYQYDVL